MALFENFPYTNFHELNLDWILQVVIAMDGKLDRAIATKIKTSDPLQWDITKQYEEYTIVMDDGNAYLSMKAVPYGIPLSDTEYWSKIFDLGMVFDTLKDAITVEDDGNNIYSSKARTAGSLVWLNDKLNIVTAAIALGDQYSAANVRQASVEELIRITKDQIYNEINSLSGYVNDELSRKVTKPDYGKYIIIGDSYVTMGLGEQIKTILSLDAIVFPAGGGGFAGTAGTYTFQTALEAVAGTLTETEKAAITDIMILGGYNDFSFTPEAIGTAINSFDTYVRANFPNALVTIGMVAYSTRDSDLGLIENTVIPTYEAYCMVKQWRYIPNANAPIHFTSAMSSDGVHPIPGGISSLANYISTYIHSNSAHYAARKRDYVHTEKLATSGNIYFDTVFNDSIVTILATTAGYVFSESYTFANSLNFSSATLIGHFDGFMRGNVYGGVPSVAIPIQVRSVWINNATFEDCDGIVYICNGNMYLAIQRKYPNHTGSFDSRSFVIEPFSFSIAADQC